MLECYVSGQSLKLYTPVIAADSLHYLTGRVHFSGPDWDGHSAWLHFRQGETVYDVALDAEGAFGEEAELSLTLGEWTLYLTGSDGEDRLTTVPVMLTVKESGLVDAPLHPMPLSVAEQIDSKASAALAFASAVKTAAEAGDFDGRDGTSFVIRGYYDTFTALTAAVPDPGPGDAYGVGTTMPYDIYVWDEINGLWRNNGTIQGVRGERGERGATFIPALDAGGNLSWTNDAGLPNPGTQNIRGPAGEAGTTGPAGKSAFDAAVEAGYSGTEATFNAALAAVPYHNARHLPDGADPITVQTGNLANAAVTGAKIASGAVSRAKLANDALYSPVRLITATPYNISADDIGTTVSCGYGMRNTPITVNLTQEVSTTLPIGTEIAILNYFDSDITIAVSGIQVGVSGIDGGGPTKLFYSSASHSFKAGDIYSLLALKKISSDATYGDCWLLTGNVEVVS